MQKEAGSKKNLNSGDPVDIIIHEIQQLLRNETFQPGMKIPSERVLAERFSTTRGYVRKALQKLEFYGVLEIRPQKGIYISAIRPMALDALITNILNFDAFDLEDLMEARTNLEIFSSRLAALRGTEEDLLRIREAHRAFEEAFEASRYTLEEDHLFHLAIVKASGNKVLQSLITQITPEIIAVNKHFKEDPDKVLKNSLKEHKRILNAIIRGDAVEAAAAMEAHMDASRERRLDTSSAGEITQ